MWARDKRHDNEVLPHPDRSILSFRDSSRGAPWPAETGRGRADAAAGLRDPAADRSDIHAGAADRKDRAQVWEGDRLSLPRAWNQLSGRARRRPQAERNFIHPRRGLLGGRDEAWADRAYRRGDAGRRDNSPRQRFREDDVESERSGIAQRPHNRGDRPSHTRVGRGGVGDYRGAVDEPISDARADDGAAAITRVPCRRVSRDRRRSAAQSREVSYGRVGSAAYRMAARIIP